MKSKEEIKMNKEELDDYRPIYFDMKKENVHYPNCSECKYYPNGCRHYVHRKLHICSEFEAD